MPISRVRRLTSNESTPYTPITASRSPTTANARICIAFVRTPPSCCRDRLTNERREDGSIRDETREQHADRTKQRLRTRRSRDKEGRECRRRLIVRPIELGPVFVEQQIRARCLAVRGDADDGHRERASTGVDANGSTDGIAIGPPASRGPLVHDRDGTDSFRSWSLNARPLMTGTPNVVK